MEKLGGNGMKQDTLTLKVEEAAHILGISRNTCYSLISQGQIPSLRLGKRLVIPKVAIERMLENAGKAGESKTS